MNIKIRM